MFGYWLITIASVEVNGVVQPSACSDCLGVVDTGTSLITGPPTYMDPIIAQVRPAVCTQHAPPVVTVFTGRHAAASLIAK